MTICILLGEMSDDEDYDDDITSRTEFPESWLWQAVTLPDCSPGTPW